jgi:lysophospholipase L1-like esterase
LTLLLYPRHADKSLPILVVSRIPLQRDRYEKTLQQRIRLRNFQKDLVKRLKTQGDSYIYFQDGLALLDTAIAHEATVDGTHPTDLGFIMMAENLEPVIRKILTEDEMSAN